MTAINNGYPDINSIGILEKATVALARQVLDAQQNSAVNINTLEIIEIDTSETNDRASISLTIGCKINVNGRVEVENPFTGLSFSQGTGDFPFNGTHLIESYVYLVLYQHELELSAVKNPNAEAVYCSVNLTSNSTVGIQYPLSVVINQSEVPLEVISNPDGSQTSYGKEYLL